MMSTRHEFDGKVVERYPNLSIDIEDGTNVGVYCQGDLVTIVDGQALVDHLIHELGLRATPQRPDLRLAVDNVTPLRRIRHRSRPSA